MEKFAFIPGISEQPSTPPVRYKPQGSKMKFFFRGLPVTEKPLNCRWDVRVLTTAGGDGALLWHEIDGPAVQPINAEAGIFEVSIPSSLSDFIRRGAYVVSILQHVFCADRAANPDEKRITIHFNVVFDGSSPNPLYEYTPPTVANPFDVPPSQDSENMGSAPFLP